MFLERGGGREVAIAQVSAEIARYLGATSDKVYLHHDYLVKAIERHGLRITDFMFLFDVVDFGVALADRERHVTFMYLTPRGWFQISIKRALVSGRLYICTFYKTNLIEYRRKTKKYRHLSNDKRAA
jgi:hypothetical protein